MKAKCNDEFGCKYSKALDQPHPRLCMKCGHPEQAALDYDSLRILQIPVITSTQMVNLFHLLQQRDLAIQKLKEYPMMTTKPTTEFIKEVNEKIKQILYL